MAAVTMSFCVEKKEVRTGSLHQYAVSGARRYGRNRGAAVFSKDSCVQCWKKVG